MTDTTLYRKATVSLAEASAQVIKRVPNASEVNIERKIADVNLAAKTPGAVAGDEVFVATVKVAEFPPKKDEGGSEEPEVKEETPKPEGESDEGGPDEAPDDAPEDAPEDSAPEFGSDADGPGAPGEPAVHKLKPEEEMVHLLHQLVDLVKGGTPLGGGSPHDPLAGPDLPDVGAPPQGEGLGLDGPGKAPLPPPVKPHSPAMPGGAFSSVIANKDQFEFVRTDVKADGLGHRGLITEAREMVPGFRVAKLAVDEAEDTATLTMIRE